MSPERPPITQGLTGFMRQLFFYLLFALCHLPAVSQPLSLVAEKAYLKDAPSSMSIDKVATGDFRAYEGNLQMLFEATPVWVRLTLQALPKADADKLIASGPQVVRVGPHSLDHIELYENVAGKWVRQVAGDRHVSTRSVCPDDYHCFALNPDRTPTEPLYLRIQTPGLAPVDTNVFEGQAFMATVTSRVTAVTASLTVALGLLGIGIFLAWSRKTPLFYIYCLFQASVITFLAANTGLIERILPMVGPETHNFLGQASLIARYFFMLVAGWVLLSYHQPTRLYSRLVLGLTVVSLSSMTLLVLGHVQTALLLNLLIFYCIPLVHIYGIFSARLFVGSHRNILLAAYGANIFLLAIGTLSVLGGIANTRIHSAINTGGDWRLNGLFVGLVIFLIILSEEKSRRIDSQQEREALRRSSEQARSNEEKLNERSALIDMLTHELKNPLGTIQFSLATLRRAVTGDGESLQRISRIDASVKRMDDLIEHVADSNKIERSGFMTRPELMPAHELIQELIDDDPSLERFRLLIAPDAAFLADRKMLCLVLENLISNASKYSMAQTPINLGVTTQAGASTPDATNERSWTCFEISNQVAPEQAPDESRLFERYYRHPGVQGLPGMGIGLSLVASAAQKIGAIVNFRQEGQQVFFTVRIPN